MNARREFQRLVDQRGAALRELSYDELVRLDDPGETVTISGRSGAINTIIDPVEDSRVAVHKSLTAPTRGAPTMHRTRGQIAAVLLLMTCGMPVWAAGSAGISGPTPDGQGELLLDETLAALQKRADFEPNNPEAWLRLAEFYSEKVRTDTKLPSALAKQHVMSGLKAVDYALKLDENYRDALMVNSVLLVQRGRYETDPALRKKLIEQAEALKRRAERGQ